MTAPTHDTQVVMADAVIAQVIQLKDPDEAISSAIWWRVAELLRACTTATASGPHLTSHAARACVQRDRRRALLAERRHRPQHLAVRY